MKARIRTAKPAPASEENDPSFRKAEMRLHTYIDGNSDLDHRECFLREIKGGHEIRFYEDDPKNGIRLRVGKTDEDVLRAEIERFGDYSGLIVAEEGKTSPCRMHTPYGIVDIIVECRNILYLSSDEGIEIQLNYLTRTEGSTDGSAILDSYSIRYS